MEPILKTIEAKTIIGMSIRTNDERESDPNTSSIPTMWKNFFDYNVMGAIPDQIDSSVVYGVYYNYESDSSRDDYTLLIGLESRAAQKPANLDLVEIQPGNYLVFKVLEASPTGIKDTWAGIEGYFTEVGTYKRRFGSDFEIYQGRDEISIYISVD